MVSAQARAFRWATFQSMVPAGWRAAKQVDINLAGRGRVMHALPHARSVTHRKYV